MGERTTTMYCHNCQRQTSAVQPTANHILHLLITFLACGFWLPVWLLCALFPGPKRCSSCGLTTLGNRLISRAISGVAVLMLALFGFAGYTTYSSRTQSRGIQPPGSAVPLQDASLSAPATELQPPETEATPDVAATASQPEEKAEPVEDTTTKAEPVSLRTWTSANGKFKVDAEFLSKTGSKLKLKRADGKTVTVDAEKLSDDDQQWLKDRAK